MTLHDLIGALTADIAKHGGRTIPLGFGNAHSYRGCYECLAFEPVLNANTKAMLKAARKAIGETYQGYKGGDFKMNEWTNCYLANYGDCGEEIGPLLLAYMLGNPVEDVLAEHYGEWR